MAQDRLSGAARMETALPAGIDALTARGGGVWVYDSSDWFVRDRAGAYVDHEIRTIQQPPKVVATFDLEGIVDRVYKIVGASADFDLVARCEAELREKLAG